MVTNAAVSARLRVDDYFHERIWRLYGVDVFAGVTTLDEREARIADFIQQRNLAAEYVNAKAQRGVKRETWGEAFERGYRRRVEEAACA